MLLFRYAVVAAMILAPLTAAKADGSGGEDAATKPLQAYNQNIQQELHTASVPNRPYDMPAPGKDITRGGDNGGGD